MALLGESLVEEWLNRSGFFTIRGVKHGVGEMDLLAVRQGGDGSIIGWHVEAQISFRPIGYIAKLTRDILGESKRRASSSVRRTPEQVDICARQWVEDKFRDTNKVSLRRQLWPGIDWQFHFVHGRVKYPEELHVIANEGVILHAFHDVLSALTDRKSGSFSASAGGDLAEIVSYYRNFDREP